MAGLVMVTSPLGAGAGGIARALTDTALDTDVSLSLHVAVTLNVYAVPAVNPVTIHVVAVPEHAETPATEGTDVTV